MKKLGRAKPKKFEGRYRIIWDRSDQCVHGIKLNDPCSACETSFGGATTSFRSKVEGK